MSKDQLISSEEDDLAAQILETCKPWVSCPAVLMHVNQDFVINIVLQDGALKEAYLQLIDVDAEPNEIGFGLFPLNRTVRVMFNECHVSFTFTHMENLGDVNMTFTVLDPLKLELLVSQARLCSTISTCPCDLLVERNSIFAMKHRMDSSLAGLLMIRDVFETNCMLCPVGIIPEARRTWDERTHYLNASYFTSTTPVKVGCLTWNVGCGKPVPAVRETFKEVIDEAPDILFFVFQEIDMSMKSVVTGNSSLAAEWCRVINHSIEESEHSYRIVANKSLGGVYAALAVRNNLPINYEFSEPKVIRLGTHGITANKGGILFNVKAGLHAKFTFIGCHLAAHTENVDERNRQLLYLVSKVPRGTDYIVFQGDLNYRLNLTYEDAVSLIKKGQVDELIKYDQLVQSKELDAGLREMEEAPIMFMPTYKFDKGSDEYDTGPKHRVPSYTDRVLCRTSPARLAVGAAKSFLFETDLVHHVMPNARGLLTESCFTMEDLQPTFPRPPHISCYNKLSSQFSDHRPVKCMFEFDVPIEVPEKVAEFEKFKFRKLDEIASLSRPFLDVPAAASVRVGDTLTIQLRNPSLVWAHWVVQVLGTGVNVSPKKGVVFPGVSATVVIKVTEYSESPVTVMFMEEGKVGLAAIEITTRKKKLLRRKKNIQLTE